MTAATSIPAPRVRLRHPGRDAARLAYCEQQLADPTLDPTRRRVLAEKRDVLERGLRLAHRCRCCGRELTDPTSIERGVGPECRKGDHR